MYVRTNVHINVHSYICTCDMYVHTYVWTHTHCMYVRTLETYKCMEDGTPTSTYVSACLRVCVHAILKENNTGDP